MSTFNQHWSDKFELWLFLSYQEISNQFGFPCQHTNQKEELALLSILCRINPKDFRSAFKNYGQYDKSNPLSLLRIFEQEDLSIDSLNRTMEGFSQFQSSSPQTLDSILKQIGLSHDSFSYKMKSIGPGILYPFAHLLPLLLFMGDFTKWEASDLFNKYLNSYLFSYGVESFLGISHILEQAGFDNSYISLLREHRHFQKRPNDIGLLFNYSLFIIIESLSLTIDRLIKMSYEPDPQTTWKDTRIWSMYNQEKEDLKYALIDTIISAIPELSPSRKMFVWDLCFQNKSDFAEVLSEVQKQFDPSFNQRIINVLKNHQSTWQRMANEPIEKLLLDQRSFSVINSLRSSLGNCLNKCLSSNDRSGELDTTISKIKKLIKRTADFYPGD